MRIALMHQLEKPMQPLDGQPGDAADPQRRTDAAGAAGLGDRAIEARERIARPFGENTPCLGQSHGAARALEEPLAKLVLQLVDRMREWWLRHMQPLRGAAEVQLLADGEKVAEMAKLYRDRRRRTHPKPNQLALPFKTDWSTRKPTPSSYHRQVCLLLSIVYTEHTSFEWNSHSQTPWRRPRP